MNTVKKEVTTQFDLTNDILNNLSQFNITPTAKLVLLYLTSCYNPKHAEIFPKQKTIAIKLGVSERSVTRAIQELFNEGLVLIECKYTNRYKFTSRIVSQQAEILSDDLRQNDTLKRDKLSHACIEQTKETKKEQSDKLNRTEKTYSSNKGGNVYKGDDAILRDYAIKHGARNIDAYINTLKKSKSAENIIKEYRKKQNRAVYAFKQTDLLREKREQEKQERVMPEECMAFVELGKKFGIK
jgi:DNA-binding MarR family transcriptional regulator